MNLTGKPHKDDIVKLGTFYKDTKWAAQKILDDEMADYMMLKNPVDVTKTSDKPAKGFRSGLGGLLVKEDAALITVEPGVNFNNPDPDDETAKRFIDDVMEPWAIAMRKLAQQAGNVSSRLPLDLRGFGRAWDSVLPHPHLWAGDEFKEMVGKMVTTDDPAKRAGIFKDLQLAKTRMVPIRQMYVSPRGTWSDFSTEFWLPEVVEIRQMKKQEIIDRFGEKSLGPHKGDTSPTRDVFIWANHQWVCAVLPHKDGGNFLGEPFEHGFRRSPYECMEAELAPENEIGYRWLGALFYARHMLDAYDEGLSDLRELNRDDTRRPRIIKVDRDSYPENQLIEGRPRDIDIYDGLTMFMDEEIILGPTSELNPEHNKYLQETKAAIRETMIRPVERGATLSGQSQNLFTTAVQIAEREFDPSMKAITQHAERTIERYLCCVESLGEPVPVFYEQKGKGVIEVTPEQAKRWKHAAQARASRAIPIDQNIIASTAERWQALGISKETTREVVMGIGNPAAEERKAKKEMLRDALWQNVTLPALLQRFAVPGPVSPEQEAKIAEMMGSASPDLREFIEQEIGRSAAGKQKQGIPQQPQLPQEATTGAI